MRHDADRLRDITDAAERIATRVARGRQEFDANEDVQLALVRLLEIIGEACRSLTDDITDSYPTIPWRAISGLRNRVIHAYFDIDLDVVWAACAAEVPRLASQVEDILGEISG